MSIPFAQIAFAEMYERTLVAPLFRPWAELLIDEVGIGRGARVLDVACGTGIVARLARARAGESAPVVGVDSNPGMLEVARRIAPSFDWRQADAAALPLAPGEAFDVVLCQQGLQFFPDRPAAVREMHRALAPAGRLGVSTWRPDEEIPLGLALRRVAERHVGPIVDRRHALGDDAALATLLREAGFRDVRTRVVSLAIHFEDGPAFIRMNAQALVGMSARGGELSGEERDSLVAAIGAESAAAAAPYADGTGLTYDLTANVATAAR